jgi:hypothetical protein
MIWNTIANARRMMNKDSKILQQAKEMCQIRQERERETISREKQERREQSGADEETLSED